MCGIFGYVGNKNNAPQIVLEGLRKLEYRGYDSWGIGVEHKGGIVIDKHTGKIDQANPSLPQGSFAFGHTRWATHGKVNDLNAHPHLDCTGKIAVVHNGIIENFQEIKKLLDKKHKIISETDTELFAHLIEDYRKKYSFREAVRRAFLKLRGFSAFLVSEAESQTFVAVKTGSPLVIGLGEDENMISSDTNSLLALTQNIIFLEDNQLAEITKRKINIFDVETGKKVRPQIQQITWKATIATKENFPHFMIKEIYEQPKVLENILFSFKERIANFVHLLDEFPHIYLVGCGTAHYAAMAGSYLLAKVAQKEAIPVPGSEFSYKQPFLDKDALVVFLSQSGETIDIIEPLKKAKAQGVKTAALVNVFGSSLYRLADEKIWLEAGPEICVLSTKAFTAKLAVLGLTAYQLSGKVNEGRQLLKASIEETKRIIKKDYQKKYLDPLVKRLHKLEHIYAIGRGLSYPLALESALKIKEVSYIHVEGFPAGELKHGVIALIEKETPCFVFAPGDETFDAVLSGAMEIKSRGGYIIGIAQKDSPIFDVLLPVRDCAEFTSLPQAVIAQLLGYKLGVIKGLDPDKPRNLAKSVTVK